MRMCGFPGCYTKHLAKGLCAGHYNQQRRGAELSSLKAPSQEKYQQVEPVTSWDKLTIGYLAALIDGEGSIKTHKTGCNLTLSSTDLDIVERAQAWSGMGRITGPKWAKKSTKPFWRWQVSDRSDLVRLLLAIAPIMSERRRITQILPAVEYLLAHVSKPKECANCGEWFHKIGWSTANLLSRFCSKSCSRKFNYKKRKEESCPVQASDRAPSMI